MSRSRTGSLWQKLIRLKLAPLLFILSLVVTPLAVFSLSQTFLGGGEITIGLDSVYYDSTAVSDFADPSASLHFAEWFDVDGFNYIVDPDGSISFHSPENPLVDRWQVKGTATPIKVALSNGVQMVDKNGNPTSNPVASFPETGSIERDGMEYIYDRLLFQFQVDVQTVTAASTRVQAVGFSGLWGTQSSLVYGMWGYGTRVDYKVRVYFGITPFAYRTDATVVAGGVGNVYLSSYVASNNLLSGNPIDSNPWSGLVEGAPRYMEEGGRDAPAVAQAYQSVNTYYLDNPKLESNWDEVSPDDRFPHEVLIELGGYVKAGADGSYNLPAPLPALATGVDEVDVECYYNVVVEVWVVHGWEPTVSEPPILTGGNIYQEVHPPDAQDILGNIFANLFGDIGGIILIALIAVAVIVMIIIIILILAAIMRKGNGSGGRR